MNKYGKTSRAEFKTLSIGLQRTLLAVLRIHDHSIQCGHRGEERQTEYFESGASQVPYPDSKHNVLPSQGVDVSPYPYTEEREQVTYFAGMVVATGASLGVTIRWGGDWDRDNDLRDNKFDDLFHFEEITS